MKLKEPRKQWLSDPDVQSAFAAQAPEFEVARTLIKTRLRVAMTQAQVASRWEPRSLWLLGWKAVRDFPACGASRYADAVGCRPHFDLLPADG